VTYLLAVRGLGALFSCEDFVAVASNIARLVVGAAPVTDTAKSIAIKDVVVFRVNVVTSCILCVEG
jgi:hypothetical protein